MVDIRWAGEREESDKVLCCFVLSSILLAVSGFGQAQQPHQCMQYVFVLLRGEDYYVGGHLWRSDQYGNAASWIDVTPKLTGQQLVYIDC